MKRIYVNEKWCLGCHLCEYQCAFANSGERDMARALMDKKISSAIKVEQHDNISFAVSCRHCDTPLCTKGCITGALSVNDGVIKIDKDKCISCCTCVLVCPYGAVAYTEGGVMQKCELCIENSGGSPRCVAGCPNGAIVFEEEAI